MPSPFLKNTYFGVEMRRKIMFRGLSLPNHEVDVDCDYCGCKINNVNDIVRINAFPESVFCCKCGQKYTEAGGF